MPFTHDAEVALGAAVTLVNTAEDPDTLVTTDQLREFFLEHEYTGRLDGDDAELRAVRQSRPRVRTLLTADRDVAAELANQMLAEAGAVPRLVRHDHFDWHLHAVATDAPLASRILVETAMAMVDVVRSDEHSRIEVCAAEDCTSLVLDLSRNRSRRYCSTTCGNRMAQASFRARQR